MPSTTTEATRHLPTDEEIAEAERLLSKMHDEVEHLAWATKGFSRLYEHEGVIPDVLPNHADVGRLYLFAHFIDGYGDALKLLAKEIEHALPLLGEMAPNVALSRALEVNGDA